MVNVVDCNIEESEFELTFGIFTFGKGMDLFIPLAMG